MDGRPTRRRSPLVPVEAEAAPARAAPLAEAGPSGSPAVTPASEVADSTAGGSAEPLPGAKRQRSLEVTAPSTSASPVVEDASPQAELTEGAMRPPRPCTAAPASHNRHPSDRFRPFQTLHVARGRQLAAHTDAGPGAGAGRLVPTVSFRLRNTRSTRVLVTQCLLMLPTDMGRHPSHLGALGKAVTLK